MPTDTAALAAAITAFEAEFPDDIWDVDATGGAMVMRNFDIAASVTAKTPADALRSCGVILREQRARRDALSLHATFLTAEYGPEVLS